MVIAHRGASGEYPENTLLAFEQGLAAGAVMLESDLHATRDGVAVLLHDPRVERTTDGHGLVSELSLAELQALDAGHTFSPDAGRTFPFRGQGIRVPTLEEALSAFPEARFNLELKAAPEKFIECVGRCIANAEREATTLLTSADDAIMQELRSERRRLGIETALGASASDVVGFIRAALQDGPPPSDSMALQVPEQFAGRPVATPKLVEYAHRHGVEIHVWTVNSPSSMETLIDVGVDGIMSDFPARLAAVVAARS